MYATRKAITSTKESDHQADIASQILNEIGRDTLEAALANLHSSGVLNALSETAKSRPGRAFKYMES